MKNQTMHQIKLLMIIGLFILIVCLEFKKIMNLKWKKGKYYGNKNRKINLKIP